MDLKNNTGAPITFAGKTVQPGGTADFSEAEVAAGIPGGLGLISHDPVQVNPTEASPSAMPRNSEVAGNVSAQERARR